MARERPVRVVVHLERRRTRYEQAIARPDEHNGCHDRDDHQGAAVRDDVCMIARTRRFDATDARDGGLTVA